MDATGVWQHVNLPSITRSHWQSSFLNDLIPNMSFVFENNPICRKLVVKDNASQEDFAATTIPCMLKV